MNSIAKRLTFSRAIEAIWMRGEEAKKTKFVKEIVNYLQSVIDCDLFLSGKLDAEKVSGGLAEAVKNTGEFFRFVEGRMPKGTDYQRRLGDYIKILSSPTATSKEEKQEIVDFLRDYKRMLPNPDIQSIGIAA